MKIRRFRVSLLGVATLGLASVSCDGPSGESFDRVTLLRTTAEQVFVPTYAALADHTQSLDAATQAFCAAPSGTTLDDVQAAWDGTMRDYERAQAFVFGPYRTGFYEERLDTWPARTDLVDRALGDTSDLALLAPAQEGLSVYEYLTFDPIGGDAAILASFADPTLGARRCAYLAKVSSDAAIAAASLRDEWTENGGHQSQFETAGNGSTEYGSLGSAVAVVVNALVFACQDARDMRLGATIGRTGGLAADMLGHAEAVESRFSDRSVRDLLDTLDGIEAIYRGGFEGASTGGSDGGVSGGADGGAAVLGLRDYLLSQRGGAASDAKILAQLETTRAAIEAITPTLRDAATPAPGASPAVASGETAIATAYDAVRALETLFATDLAGALAVTVVISDTDGD